MSALLPWVPVSWGQLVAQVNPEWSPFVRTPIPVELADLMPEALSSLRSDPARVAEVLAGTVPTQEATVSLVNGLRGDALYLAGGDTLFEAQRMYRAVVTADSKPEQVAWAHFMLGNIYKVLGFETEAEIEYRTALGGQSGPWVPALAFDLAALAVETGRFGEAREQLSAWLRDYPGQPGRALVLFLLGECEVALGDAAAAKASFREARRLEPDGWVARPETGYALADLLKRERRPSDAASVLETLVGASPGTRMAAVAQLDVGRIWEAEGDVARAAKSYAELVDQGAPSAESGEAILRLALLGVGHADRVELTEPYPAYRVFYRPRPTLERYTAERDPVTAQRAMRGLAELTHKEGDFVGALEIFARVFQKYPESPESGLAYETFMDLLEGYLAARLEAGAHADVVDVYERLKKPMGWVATRDTGSVATQAAEAYEALGAQTSARRVYEGLLTAGTRALKASEIATRVERTRVRAGDPDALRQWVARNETDWGARLALARSLADNGETAGARDHFLAVARWTPRPEEKLATLAELARLVSESTPTGDLLASLEARRTLLTSLPPGPERDVWESHLSLVEARLRFVAGEYATAAGLFRRFPELAPSDSYLLGLAESRAGQLSRAAEIFAELAQGPDPLFAGLAVLHTELSQLAAPGGAL